MMSSGNFLFGILNALKSVAQSNQVHLKTIAAALLLYGVKEFLNDIVFHCPERDYVLYGSLFIFGPAMLLFCLSLLNSPSFWQVVTGCFLLTCRQRKLLWFKAKDSIYVASMPPVIWLVYAFVEEDYYVCAKLGRLDLALARANTSSEQDAVKKEFAEASTDSQFIAWALILGLVILTTIFVTVYRLCMPIDPKILGKDAFHEFEANEAVALFNKKVKPMAEEEAKKLVEDFFEKNKSESSEEQIKLGEEYLKKLFPRHAGVLNGPFRVEDVDSPQGQGTEACGGETDGESIEMKPKSTAIVYASHA